MEHPLSKSKAQLLLSKLSVSPPSRSRKGKEADRDSTSLDASTSSSSRASMLNLNPSELEKELEELELQKEGLEINLREAVRELEEVSSLSKLTPSTSTSDSTDSKRLAILEHELISLEVEISSLQARAQAPNQKVGLEGLPGLSSLSALEDLERTVSELNRAVAYETTKSKKEERDLARDKQLLSDATYLSQLLSSRALKASQSSHSITVESIILEKNNEVDRLNALFGQLMASLIAFIDERLVSDELSDEEDEPPRKKSRKGMQEGKGIRDWIRSGEPNEMDDDPEEHSPIGRGLALKSILESLMNTAVMSPSQPYLSLEDTPQEIIVFLVNAGILLLDPKDGRRGRLRAFGAL